MTFKIQGTVSTSAVSVTRKKRSSIYDPLLESVRKLKAGKTLLISVDVGKKNKAEARKLRERTRSTIGSFLRKHDPFDGQGSVLVRIADDGNLAISHMPVRGARAKPATKKAKAATKKAAKRTARKPAKKAAKKMAQRRAPAPAATPAPTPNDPSAE